MTISSTGVITPTASTENIKWSARRLRCTLSVQPSLRIHSLYMYACILCEFVYKNFKSHLIHIYSCLHIRCTCVYSIQIYSIRIVSYTLYAIVHTCPHTCTWYSLWAWPRLQWALLGCPRCRTPWWDTYPTYICMI